MLGEEENTAIGFRCKPAKFEIIDPIQNKALYQFFVFQKLTFSITVYEGKYHQIRRMLAAIGNRAKTVHRAQVGSITLGDLAPGQWRLLTKEEVASLMKEDITTSENKTSDLD